MRFPLLAIELGFGMELILNLAWSALAGAMGVLWLCFGLRHGASRRVQLVALTVLVLILFPVISVSDDIQAMQNPAEADCCVRRDHVVAGLHSILPPVVALFQSITTRLATGAVRIATISDHQNPMQDHPGLAVVANRPPPAA